MKKIRRTLVREKLIPAGATIVVGVSGGPDSVCLLHALNQLRPDFGWTLHVAHLHHRLRGADADADMVYVVSLAMDWDLPCTLEVADVEAVARQRRLSLEEAARQVRYGFLGDVARAQGAGIVAVGHHADDQSETVLMHFLRGTGLAGLRGMLPATDLSNLRVAGDLAPPGRIRLVRPLLDVTRAEIEAYCETHQLSPRFDRSNLDTTYFRNRLRHKLLPALETYNPNIRAVLRRTAAVAAADYALIASLRAKVWEQIVHEAREHRIVFDRAGWRALPLALQRATLRHAAYRLRPQLRDVDFEHIQNGVDIALHGHTGTQATLPQGLVLTVSYETLTLTTAESQASTPEWPLLWRDNPLPVSLSGDTPLPDSGWRLQARPWDGPVEAVLHNPDRWTAYLDRDRLGERVALRPRRPGDRFQPLGMNRQTKVADWMINAKVPARWRDCIPLLVHGPPADTEQDEIAWIVGWRTDERVKITPDTRRVVRLQFTRKDHETTRQPVD